MLVEAHESWSSTSTWINTSITISIAFTRYCTSIIDMNINNIHIDNTNSNTNSNSNTNRLMIIQFNIMMMITIMIMIISMIINNCIITDFLALTE